MNHILQFFRDLESNNNRDWFNAHKSEYLKARDFLERVVEQVIAGLGQVDPHIRGIKAKDTIFRIYRDTRFSHDKTPYKTNMGAHISAGGKNAGEPGYYFHIQPGECFVSGGIYMPPSDKLKAIRKEIYLFPEDFKELIDDPFFRKNFTLFDEDKLKRPPLGYPADFPLIEYLKFKNYCPWAAVPDEWLDEPGLAERITQLYVRMKPFNDFIYRAIEG
jgi:uncharacterized protein (TIGR02453 family)